MLRRGARARDDLKNCLVVYTIPRINFAEIIHAFSDYFFTPLSRCQSYTIALNFNAIYDVKKERLPNIKLGVTVNLSPCSYR